MCVCVCVVINFIRTYYVKVILCKLVLALHGVNISTYELYLHLLFSYTVKYLSVISFVKTYAGYYRTTVNTYFYISYCMMCYCFSETKTEVLITLVTDSVV